MSNDRFVELLYELRPKLTEAEILHLIFIKLIQDTEVPEFGLQSKLSKLLLKSLSLITEKDKQTVKKTGSISNANELISYLSLCIFKYIFIFLYLKLNNIKILIWTSSSFNQKINLLSSLVFHINF